MAIGRIHNDSVDADSAYVPFPLIGIVPWSGVDLSISSHVFTINLKYGYLFLVSFFNSYLQSLAVICVSV